MIRLTVLVFTLFCSSSALAQISPPTMVVKKVKGENIRFAWEYDKTEEPGITNFRLKRAYSLTGPFVHIKSVARNLRTVSVKASFPDWSRYTYYAISAVNSTTTPTEESELSNTVAAERVRRRNRTEN